MSELLETFQREQPRNDRGSYEGTTGPTQRSTAEAIGLSKKQEMTIRAVGKIPGVILEQLVESDNPPSITALAEIGRSGKVDPKSFVKTTSISGVLTAFLSQVKSSTLEQYCAGIVPYVFFARKFYRHPRKVTDSVINRHAQGSPG